jgi:hypothetical protein
MTGNALYRFSQAHGLARKEAIHFHRQRYQAIGFMPEGFQDPYEPDALYFGAWHRWSNQIVGVCRLIFQELWKLSTLSSFELFEQDRQALARLAPGTYTEFGAFTKLPEHDVAAGLLSVAIQYTADAGLTHVLCCVDQRVMKHMQQRFGLPYRVIGIPRAFHGSIKVPSVLSVTELVDCMEALHRPRTQGPAEHVAPFWTARNVVHSSQAHSAFCDS